MAESEYSPDNYKAFKISIGNPEMVKFISDYLKANKMCKNAVKKLPFVIMYVPD